MSCRSIVNAIVASSLLLLHSAVAADLGIFEGNQDIGAPGQKGGVKYDAAAKTYTVSGGGENMWFAKDDLHFAWKKMEGNASIAADIAFPKSGGNAHRKAVLMFRQSLDPDSPYIDVAVHGDGLASLQFRETKGGPTREIQANISSPKGAQLVKSGNRVYLYLDPDGKNVRFSGASYAIQLEGEFFAGIGVCAHDNAAIEEAVFSDVQIQKLPADIQHHPAVESSLEIIPIGSKDRKIVYQTNNHIEAPNWSRDGKFLVYNSRGRIYRIDLDKPEPAVINTGFAGRCNNDHGISPDGQQLVISDQTKTGKSMIYVLPLAGGEPKQITEQGPSYWHGWSPDGKMLAYCAERNNNFDVYVIPAEGGQEKRLTDAEGLDDGPDYSHDGQHIYFNSERTGTMQIWRMNADGSDQRQITNDAFNNWFPHPSPDGKWLAILSYDKDVKGHPANKDVQLRLMNLETGEIQVLTRLFGGQGTINVPSWSPDSKQIAFVSYHFTPRAHPQK